MRTFVTVTCERDKKLQILQSHSLDIFCTKPIHHIVIIQDNCSSLTSWKRSLSPYYGRHRLTLLSRDDFKQFPNSLYDNGYFYQQHLKLEASSIIDTAEYTILDSKNIIIAEFDPKELSGAGNTEGHYHIEHEDMNPWVPWINFIEQKLKYSIPEKFMWPLTPFTFKTKVAKQICEQGIFVKLCNDVHKINRKGLLPSEFILYQFYHDNSINMQYKPIVMDSLQYCGGVNSDFLQDKKIISIKKDSLLLSPEEKQFLIDFLKTKNLKEKLIQSVCAI